jgi:hypothetical protein
MQTFVAFDNFEQSAYTLDSKRLNKQLLEGRQIYSILASGKTSGPWTNHPAVKMWRGFDMGLFSYLKSIKDECDLRGIKTENNWTAILEIHKSNWFRGTNIVMPNWWGDKRVHLSHQFNLYKKDPEYYQEFKNTFDNGISTCCDRCQYFWPVSKHAKEYSQMENFSYINH